MDFSAMASREEWMGWDSCNVWRNTRQGTMALQVEGRGKKRVMEEEVERSEKRTRGEGGERG